MERLVLLVLGSMLACYCEAAVSEDLITSLPGVTKMPSYKQYSGYLKATNGRMLHYWFVESQNNPVHDPVVLWLNGGPGCSSLDGFLSEHGPLEVNEDGTKLMENPYSWNLLANMLYLEAPAGVGYSYSADKNYTTDDDQVSKDNFVALKDFFMKYSEYKNNDFYITGESYGGIYVPTLSARVVDDPQFKFKGFAVGNGVTDSAMDDNAIIYFGYAHGLWGDDLWTKMLGSCCTNYNASACNFHKPSGQLCKSLVGQAMGIISQLNIYNLYAECYHQVPPRGVATVAPLSYLFPHNEYVQQIFRPVEALRSSRLSEVPPCIDATGLTNYLNNMEVRKALHIPDSLPKWEVCSAEVGMKYKRIYDTVKPQYMKVLSSGKYRILVYNGDVDMACNFLGDEWFVDSLGQKMIVPRKPWFYNNGQSQQTAGFAKYYKNLAFVTVKGSGHMVPQDKPLPALVMFANYLKNATLVK